MSFGLDPMTLLAAAPGDAQIMIAALERAYKDRLEYDEALARLTGARVAEAVVPPLAKSIGKLVNALARAMSSS